MNIEDWEVERFIKDFSESPMFEAIMWLEDRGCYHATENTNCELMRDLSRAMASPKFEEKYGEIANSVWVWAKSAAIEELEKLNGESLDD